MWIVIEVKRVKAEQKITRWKSKLSSKGKSMYEEKESNNVSTRQASKTFYILAECSNCDWERRKMKIDKKTEDWVLLWQKKPTKYVRRLNRAICNGNPPITYLQFTRKGWILKFKVISE